MVSVIIVTYNAARTLRNAVESVLNQTFKMLECIIVDGASTDDTMKIVMQNSLIDKRIRYISEPDKGIYDAMNKGWKMAKGEWILYLGADDELNSHAVELLINKSRGDDIVYGDTILVLGNGKSREQISKEVSRITINSITCHQSLIMRREAIKELGGFDTSFKIIADYDLILRAYKSSFKFLKINGFISKFSLEGTSGKHITKVNRERYKIYKKNNANRSPLLWALLYFIKDYIVYFKHKTVDKIMFYK